MTKTKLYNFTNTSLTFGLGLLLFYFLFHSISSKDIPTHIEMLKWDWLGGLCIALALLLTIVNWAIEAFKWNALIKSIHRLSNRELIGSIALGLCANILAPNRTGELAARLNHIPSTKRRSALYLNLFSASSQLMVTFLAGSISMIILMPRLGMFSSAISNLITIVLFILVAVSLTIFLKSQFLKQLLLKKLSKQHQTAESVEIGLSKRLKVLMLSALRYIIFLIQFYLILIAFQMRIDFLNASLILASSFLINSFIPSNWLTEVLTKGSVIYFLSELLNYDPLLMVSASFGLWFINLLIPSSLSIYFLKDIDWLRLIRS